jgi:hypothetical protein
MYPQPYKRMKKSMLWIRIRKDPYENSYWYSGSCALEMRIPDRDPAEIKLTQMGKFFMFL